jgi:hypothetical protein
MPKTRRNAIEFLDVETDGTDAFAPPLESSLSGLSTQLISSRILWKEGWMSRVAFALPH